MKDFLQALSHYIDTKAEITKAEASCEYSRGYYLHDLYEARDKAIEECEERLRVLFRHSHTGATE